MVYLIRPFDSYNQTKSHCSCERTMLNYTSTNGYVEQQTTRKLPNVSVLANTNRKGRDRSISDTSKFLQDKKCTIEYKDSSYFSTADRSDHFISFDVKCPGGCDYQVALPAAYKYSAHEDETEQVRATMGDVYDEVHFVAANLEMCNTSVAVSQMRSPKYREPHHQKMERMSYSNPIFFTNHQHVASSGDHMEPLASVIMVGEEQVDLNKSVSDDSSGIYGYQNNISTWKQNNDKFTDFTWGNVHASNSFVEMNVVDPNNENNLLTNQSIVNISLDNNGGRPKQSHRNNASPDKLTFSHARRRRKRIQTQGQRTAANTRERRRMCHLNVAFDHLKERLPNIKDKKKLSRIQTLKAAIYYIHLLRDSLSLC